MNTEKGIISHNFFFLLVGLGFEHRASVLQSKLLLKPHLQATVAMVILEMGSLKLSNDLPGLASNLNPLIPASQGAKNTGKSHRCQTHITFKNLVWLEIRQKQ
jgi:hypothetical protein